MKPKEKAQEIYNKIDIESGEVLSHSLIKKISLITVNQILLLEWTIPVILHIQDKNDIEKSTVLLSEYWKSVKQEIIKL